MLSQHLLIDVHILINIYQLAYIVYPLIFTPYHHLSMNAHILSSNEYAYQLMFMFRREDADHEFSTLTVVQFGEGEIIEKSSLI